MALYDLLSEEDRKSLGLSSQGGYVRSFNEALNLLDKYRWFGFVPLKVDPDFFYAILQEVRKRGGLAAESRWRSELNRVKPALDLRQLVQELIKNRVHCDSLETAAENAVIGAIDQPDHPAEARRKAVIGWLNRYSVLRGISADSRSAIASQIIGFADERPYPSLQLDKDKIVTEFNRLADRISTVTERRADSLVSKALWCCYPDDIPIFDRNAVCALRLISRLCRFTPAPKQPEYASFVDVWLSVYREIEDVIPADDVSECPHKVRTLDRLLWYLGQDAFYNGDEDS